MRPRCRGPVFAQATWEERTDGQEDGETADDAAAMTPVWLVDADGLVVFRGRLL